MDANPEPTTDAQTAENPLITLQSGETLPLNQLDLTIEEQAEAYFDYTLDGVTDSRPSQGAAPNIATVPTSSPVANDPSHEERIGENIAHLEKALTGLRTTLDENFSPEVLREIETKSAELKELKDRQRNEARLKDHERDLFLRAGVGDSQDFERLWRNGGRDEAIRRQVDRLRTVIGRHPIYSEF